MEVDSNVLPGDVLPEVFSRLPMKARLRCEAVSKKWQNLINEKTAYSSIVRALDSGFVGVNHRMVNFYGLDDKGAFHLQDPLVTPFNRNDIWYIGSCNGFLFFLKRDDGIPIKLTGNLYNPVTRHLTTLPPSPLSEEDYPSAIGFAPDPETNHYEFLVFYLPYPRETDSKGSLTLAVAIFNSETREWKTTKRPIGNTAQLTKMNPIGNLLGPATLYSRGSLYWLRESPWLSIFSMKTKAFRFLSLPKAQGKYRGVLWESEGSIHYCQFCEIEDLCIWVLEEKPAWRKIYSVAPVPRNIISGVLGFNEHLQIVLLETSECLVWYDITAKRMSPIPPSKDLPALGMEYLSFTYNNKELPNINEPVEH